jgi:NADP-dependent 3-hydroxy acid dehydrogenase YdfG
MSTVTLPSPIHREPELLGETVVVIGRSAGVGFEAERRAREEGAKVILTGRSAERLQQAASEVDALSTAAFDAADPVALDRFFRDLGGDVNRARSKSPRSPKPGAEPCFP